MHYTLSEIPGGVAGTDRTVREIAKHVRDDLKRPALRLYATRLMQSAGAGSKDQLAEARAIYNHVANAIRYQKDPVGIETVQSPLVTLRLKAGDCDDQVALVAGLANAVGIPARFRVVGYSSDDVVHIFSELFVAGRWYPADTTEPGHGFGWRPPKFPMERVYNLNGKVDAMNLSQFPILTRGELKSAIYLEVTNVLTSNWQNGLINLADVKGYLDVIAQGNFPSKEPVLVEPTERAIRDFVRKIEREKIGSVKPAGQLSGMEGLDGFLSSVWNGVKSVVKTVAKVVTGGGSQPVVKVSPTVVVPAATVQASAGTAEAFGAGMFGSSSMLPILIGGALVLVLLLKK